MTWPSIRLLAVACGADHGGGLLAPTAAASLDCAFSLSFYSLQPRAKDLFCRQCLLDHLRRGFSNTELLQHFAPKAFSVLALLITIRLWLDGRNQLGGDLGVFRWRFFSELLDSLDAVSLEVILKCFQEACRELVPRCCTADRATQRLNQSLARQLASFFALVAHSIVRPPFEVCDRFPRRFQVRLTWDSWPLPLPAQDLE